MIKSYIQKPLTVILRRLACAGETWEAGVDPLLSGEGEEVVDPQAVNVWAGGMVDVLHLQHLKA
jgi:hypothetical protein